jgi:hypothetical protein
MRSMGPSPVGDWPREMTIVVDDRPTVLLELLWVRDAYDLHPPGVDAPPLAEPTNAHLPIDDASRHVWERAWITAWRDAVEHMSVVHDSSTFDRLHRTPNGSSERADLLASVTGPDWQDAFGDDAPDVTRMSEWLERQGPSVPSSTSEEPPERRDQPVLVGAWRRGLTKVVTIPCEGAWAKAIAPNALLVTTGTRADRTLYREALDSFA